MKKTFALILAFALCLGLCACGGVDERYTTLIECLDNHDYEGAMSQVTMLRQQAIDNGDIVVVEPQEEDYELVSRYSNVVNFLMEYSPYSYQSLYVQSTEEWLSGNEALAYAYAELQALEGVDQWLNSEYFSFEEGFPTDRAALLDRFTNIGKKLIRTERTTLDNMGNESTGEGRMWFYDENGTLTSQYMSWNDSQQYWEYFYSQSGHYRSTYDASGLITQTKLTDLAEQNTYALIVPTYDENGYLIGETITDNNGEYVFTYTNDENGNRIQMAYADDWNDFTILYTYDDSGNLIQKDRIAYYDINENTRYVDAQKTTVYTYDASGNLTSATITTQDNQYTYRNGGYETYLYSEKIDTVSYTTDVDGNLIQEIWQYGETIYEDGEVRKPDYTSETIDYIYADYYIFH